MKDYLKIILTFVVTSLIFFGYYIVTKETHLDIVYKNWDGPSYVLAAMSLYQPSIADENNFIHSVNIHPDWTWLPAHFPGYTLAIRALSFLGYFPAMLLLSVLFGLATLLAFYKLVRDHNLTKYPLLLTLPLIFLSPRWFILSHTGSSESMFLFFLIMFLNFFMQKKHLPAAIFLALSQVTRPHAVFFGVGVFLIFVLELFRSKNIQSIIKNYLSYLIVPFSVFLIFCYYKLQTGNFWAFFEAISLTKNLQPLPFQTFSFPGANIETFWQEVNAIDYVVYLSACLIMFRKKYWQLGIISLTYFVPLIFLQHSDISRYAVPLLPFAFIAYSEIIEKKEFTWATILMSPGIMLYAINFMDNNHGI